VLVQLGDRNNRPSDKEAVEIMTDYVTEFRERNPNLHIVGAYIHLDEASPHLHLDYIPLGHLKTGMEIQNSLKQALAEQGYTTQKGLGTAQEQWTRAERGQLELLCKAHHIEIEHKKENREHLDKETYILLSQKKELEKENEKVISILDRLERKYKDIERSEVKPATPHKTFTGHNIIDFAEHKSIVDKMNAENYKLRNEVSMWRDRAMTHAEARERLEQSLRAENERYVERDIEVEQLRNILQFSKEPKEDYILWEKDHDYEPTIEKELISR